MPKASCRRRSAFARRPRSQALHLRYLTTMQGLASDRTSLILFPMPLEFIEAFARGRSGAGDERKAQA